MPDQAMTPHSAASPFLGLAPFLRMSIAGTDLLPIGQQMLAQTEHSPDDANLWLNLAIVMLCLGQRDLGLAIQAQALALQRVYCLAAAQQPAKLRVLMLMVPGDLSANTPLECLLENTDIDLIFYYLAEDQAFRAPVPEHDVLVVALGETDANRQLFTVLEEALANWPKPVLNAPQNIPRAGRDVACRLLQNAPGILIPPTLRATRAGLQAIAEEKQVLAEQFDACAYPLIVRPLGSHAGRDLAKIDDAAALAGYLAKVSANEFFLSRFIDYSGADGLFRKFRIALIDGVPYACHMGVSAHWMIHYVNAGMYEDAQKRAEEAAFMAGFDDFVARHSAALKAIHEQTRLDYVCIDCAETRAGDFLVFEIDHAMVVHAMDSDALFPYKQIYMQKVKDALRAYLLRLASAERQA